MRNKCSSSNYHGCPASLYMRCRAYAEALNCWEVDEKPCCANTDFSICQTCEVYIRCSAKEPEVGSFRRLVPFGKPKQGDRGNGCQEEPFRS